MKRLISLLGSGLLCLLLFGGAHAQGVGSSGEIKGTVIDPNGAVLPNAAVAVVGVETGFRRTCSPISTPPERLWRWTTSRLGSDCSLGCRRTSFNLTPPSRRCRRGLSEPS